MPKSRGFRAPRRVKTLAEKLGPELRARMVEALLDAVRERRLRDACGFGPGNRSKHHRLYEAAANHALTLADQHLTLMGE